jgi:ubiquinone/menaquinone biosynthesis C-methylase UbiE
MDPAEIQKQFYISTADNYDAFHLNNEKDPEHNFALHFLASVIEQLKISSILDVGSGTGRVINYLLSRYPHLKIIGIEPVKELRERAYGKGIPEEILHEGDGNNIQFEDQEFDLVCAFGVLHHVERPRQVIKEMLRVSAKAVFISDSNNFGQGGKITRFIKQTLDILGLWTAVNYVKTRGKKYQISEEDGLFYSYSVFNDYHYIRKSCSSVHLLNTSDGGKNLYRGASHIGLLAIKKSKY